MSNSERPVRRRVRNLHSDAESRDDVLRDVREAVLQSLGGKPGLAEPPTEPEFGARANWGSIASRLRKKPLHQGREEVLTAVRWAMGFGSEPGGGGAAPEHGPALRVPLGWFQRLTREYRGKEAPYTDAILVLALIVERSVRGGTDGPGVLYLPPETRDGAVCRALRITREAEDKALAYLEGEGLVTRVIVKGVVPWWLNPRPGTYRFVVLDMVNLKYLNDSDYIPFY